MFNNQETDNEALEIRPKIPYLIERIQMLNHYQEDNKEENN